MNIFYIIKNLCDKRKITIFELERQIGISRGILYTWKKSSPSVEKVKKVAEFFYVSMDELVNHKVEDNNVVEVENEEDRKVVDKILSLNDRNNKLKVEGLMDYFSLQEQENKDYTEEFINTLKSSRSIKMDIQNEHIKLPKRLLEKMYASKKPLGV